MYICITSSVHECYNQIVRVPITRFRKDLFGLADAALEGELIEFVHKGVVFQVIPERKKSKLARLKGLRVVAEDSDLAGANRDLMREMEAKWEKDWADL